MAIFLKFIAVIIPLAVEVAGNKPVGLEEFLGRTDTECTEKKLFKLIIGKSVFFTGTDIIESSPEFIGNIIAANIYHQSCAVFNGCPFKNAVDGNMEHNGIDILKDFSVKNTGLSERYPVFKSAVGENFFCNSLGNGIVVIN